MAVRSLVRWTVLPAVLSFALISPRAHGQRAGSAGATRQNGEDTLAVPRRPRDAWIGRDKVRHFGSSAAIQLMGYGALRATGASRRTGVVTASAITIAAGIGKELWDVRRGGQASRRDLTWDVAGLLAGTGLARIGDPR